MVYTVLYSIKSALTLTWTVDGASFLLGVALGAVLLLLMILVIWLAIKL